MYHLLQSEIDKTFNFMSVLLSDLTTLKKKHDRKIEHKVKYKYFIIFLVLNI